METADFSQPLRQSSKGIIIIFALNAVKFFRNFFAVLIALGVALVRKNSFLSLTPLAILLILVGVLILILIIAVLKYLNFKFHLSETDFHLATGILNKDTTIIPKTKIQNVHIQQNFLQQIINVVSLKIETAGDKASEIEISALDKATALQLKKELFSKNHIEAEHIEAIDDTNVFYKISIKRLLLEGILQNHLRSFAIMISFVVGLYYQVKEYFQDFEIGIDDGYAFDNESMFQLMYVIILIVAVGLIVSVVFSVIRVFVVNFNLEVVDNHKTLEINKGLFNKMSLSLTPSKIQNIVIKTNALKQYFDMYTLNVKQAMANAKQHKNFGIIALRKDQINQLIDKLVTDYSIEGELLKPEPYYKRIMALRMLLFLAVFNFFAVMLFDLQILWTNVLWVPLVVLFIILRYKKAYYNVTERFVTVGSGAIDTTTNILEINKIQAVKLSQTFFQRRKKIASVVIYTASKAVTIPYIKENDAKSIYDFLLFRVEYESKDWM